ncbi:unnamed protein product [Boreogadus saida]
MATSGLSAHIHSLLSSRHRPFGPLSDSPRGNLRSHMLPVVPPEPLEAGGQAAGHEDPAISVRNPSHSLRFFRHYRGFPRRVTDCCL